MWVAGGKDSGITEWRSILSQAILTTGFAQVSARIWKHKVFYQLSNSGTLCLGALRRLIAFGEIVIDGGSDSANFEVRRKRKKDFHSTPHLDVQRTRLR